MCTIPCQHRLPAFYKHLMTHRLVLTLLLNLENWWELHESQLQYVAMNTRPYVWSVWWAKRLGSGVHPRIIELAPWHQYHALALTQPKPLRRNLPWSWWGLLQEMLFDSSQWIASQRMVLQLWDFAWFRNPRSSNSLKNHARTSKKTHICLSDLTRIGSHKRNHAPNRLGAPVPLTSSAVFTEPQEAQQVSP